jgi:hypothetical protein
MSKIDLGTAVGDLAEQDKLNRIMDWCDEDGLTEAIMKQPTSKSRILG